MSTATSRSRILKKRIETIEVRDSGLYRITETIDYTATHTTPDFAVIWTGNQENLVEPVASYHAEFLAPLSRASATADDRSQQYFVTITVGWGWDVEVSIELNPDQWEEIEAGRPLQVRGKGFRYEGAFYQDYWYFAGGTEGDLRVQYGEDGGVGFEGKLSDDEVEIRRGLAA